MANEQIILTGIKPTGLLHVGNWAGAVKPSIELERRANTIPLYFIADYHAVTTMRDGAKLSGLTSDIAAAWIACGLDTNKSILFRQSDIPEVFELSWVLACFTAKGLMNRAHAYKAAVQVNRDKNLEDLDAGINMGVYEYPVLMAADILLYGSHLVPVGKDQVQHVEIACDIAERFNHAHGQILQVPKAQLETNGAYLPGLDGRKMSKSYDNTVTLFDTPENTKKRIKKYVTDSSDPKTPKDPEKSDLFRLYEAFATKDEVEALRARYQSGIGWGDVKEEVGNVVNRTLDEPRRKFREIRDDSAQLEQTLRNGAERARVMAKKMLAKVRDAVGMRAVGK